MLSERGHFPYLRPHYMEQSANSVTSSGAVYAVELMLNLLTEHLSQLQIAELSAQLQVKTVRHG
ncbi:hypothetical protein [Epibacterium ulvae]|uniref:hypothetical protein n=1 Tax=Epibacterium ulvae TaxID=1156985 RepID=UPI001114203A|nr:hypothetical protein [Epibacterium ulvae]